MVLKAVFFLLAVGPACAEPAGCDCGPHGHCQDGLCVCNAGYFGPRCADASCVKDCRGHGVCTQGACFCEDGWAGESCGMRAVDVLLDGVARREEAAVNGELRDAAAELHTVVNSTVVPEAPPVAPELGDPALDQARAARAQRRVDTDRHLTLVDQLLSQLERLTAAPQPAPPAPPAPRAAPVAPSAPAPAQAAPEPHKPAPQPARAAAAPAPKARAAAEPARAAAVPEPAHSAAVPEPAHAPAVPEPPHAAPVPVHLKGGGFAAAPGWHPAKMVLAEREGSTWGKALRGHARPQVAALQDASAGHDDHEDGGPWSRPRASLLRQAPAEDADSVASVVGDANSSVTDNEDFTTAPNASLVAGPPVAGPNTSVGTEVYTGDELSDPMHAADETGEVYAERQKYFATALCGGCGGHGVCDRDTRKCICDRPFFGEHCTEFLAGIWGSCTLDCGQHGICYGEDPPKCHCAPGWYGPRCEQERCLNDCNNRGACINKQCVCNDLFIGADCNERRCTGDCYGHGTCSNAECTCDSGYGGDACEKILPPDITTPLPDWKVHEAPFIASTVAYVKTMPLATCPETCSHHGKCVDNKCNCYTGYTGDSCENFCPNFCSHQGECIEGSCLCVAGFIGVDCSISACCNGHGDCSIPDTCICSPGWMGAACGIPMPCFDAMCNGHGACDGAACKCEPGWTGEKCTEAPPECPAPCQHGTCNRLQGICACDDGWEGAACENAAGTAAAAAKKKAKELSDPEEKAREKKPGASGPLDDVGSMGSPTGALERIAAREAAAEEARKKAAAAAEEQNFCGKDDACSGHGSCNTTLEACVCQENWDGALCDFEHCPGFNETAGIEDCFGHGMCALGECHCAPGWGTPSEAGTALPKGPAEACESRVCPSACSAHGTCTEGTCVCLGGWAGDTCHRPDCPNKCSAHGTCAFWAGSDSPGECECYPGFSGGDCSLAETSQRQCPNNCNGNGLCLDGRCVCSDGFRGPDCGEPVCSDPLRLGPECDIHRCTNDCQGQGLCFNGACECWDTWYGQDCGIPRDCLEACGHLCDADSRTPHCSSCLGDCETLLAGNNVGKHSWTEDVRT